MRGIEWAPDKLITFIDKMAELHDKGFIPFLFHLPLSSLYRVFLQIMNKWQVYHQIQTLLIMSQQQT